MQLGACEKALKLGPEDFDNLQKVLSFRTWRKKPTKAKPRINSHYAMGTLISHSAIKVLLYSIEKEATNYFTLKY